MRTFWLMAFALSTCIFAVPAVAIDTSLKVVMEDQVYFVQDGYVPLDVRPFEGNIIAYRKNNQVSEFVEMEISGRVVRTIGRENNAEISEYFLSGSRRFIVYRLKDWDGVEKIKYLRVRDGKVRTRGNRDEVLRVIYNQPDTDLLYLVWQNTFSNQYLLDIDLLSGETFTRRVIDFLPTGLMGDVSGTLVIGTRSDGKYWERIVPPVRSNKELKILGEDVNLPIFSRHRSRVLYFLANSDRNEGPGNSTELREYLFDTNVTRFLFTRSNAPRYGSGFRITRLQEGRNTGRLYFIFNRDWFSGNASYDPSVENNLFYYSEAEGVSEKLLDIRSDQRVSDYWISDDERVIAYTLENTYTTFSTQKELYILDRDNGSLQTVYNSGTEDVWIRGGQGKYRLLVKTGSGWSRYLLEEKRTGGDKGKY